MPIADNVIPKKKKKLDVFQINRKPMIMCTGPKKYFRQYKAEVFERQYRFVITVKTMLVNVS